MMGVKNGNIHTYIMEEKGFDYTIQSIRMGYMTQIEDGAMHFFPVWYFQCKLGEKVLHYWLWMQEMVLLFIWDKEGYNKR